MLERRPPIRSIISEDCTTDHMYGHHIQQEKDQPNQVANPARGQLNGKMNISLSPIESEDLVSRDGFGSAVPRQPTHLHNQTDSGAYLRDSSQFPRGHPFIYLNRHTPSGQHRVYRVAQMRTDGVLLR